MPVGPQRRLRPVRGLQITEELYYRRRRLTDRVDLPGRSSAGSPGTAGPRSACSPTSTTSRSPSPHNANKRPASAWAPDSSRSPFRSCCGSCATPSSHRPCGTGPTGCTGQPGAAYQHRARQAHRRWNALRRDNAMITTNYSCRCAGINRHEGGDGRAPRRRASDPR